MINNSLTKHEFYDNWKLATVQPLIKNPGLDCFKINYRPISNLSFVSKLAEKAAIQQINNHLSTNILHSSHQNAYKEIYSTETTLCLLMNNLLWLLEKQHVAILVSLHLSAAFNTVHDDILLTVLNKNFGFTDCGLQWITSYLYNRCLKVQIGCSLSSEKNFQLLSAKRQLHGPTSI